MELSSPNEMKKPTRYARFGFAVILYQALGASAPGAALEFNTNRFGGDIRSFELDSGAHGCASACAAEAHCRAFTWVKPGVQGVRARCWLKSTVPAAKKDPNCISGVMPAQPGSLGGQSPGAGSWGVWAYRIGADVGAWTSCDIQYVAARRPARYDDAPNYRLVRNTETRAAADQYVSLFSRYHDDQPDFVVKMAPCNPHTTVVIKPPEDLPARAVNARHASNRLEYDIDRAGNDYRNFELDSGASSCREACRAETACRAFTWVKPGVQGKRARCWLKDGVPQPARDLNCVSGIMNR